MYAFEHIHSGGSSSEKETTKYGKRHTSFTYKIRPIYTRNKSSFLLCSAKLKFIHRHKQAKNKETEERKIVNIRERIIKRDKTR